MPRMSYCFTLNNWTPMERQQILDIRPQVQYLCLAEEVGEQGTPHLQGYLQLNAQVKYTTMQRWAGWNRVHFETSRGTDQENYNYIHGPYTKNGKNKPENPTFTERGERQSMGRPGARSDLSAVKKSISEGLSYEEVCEIHFDEAAKYNRFIKEQIGLRDANKQLDSLREAFACSSLKPWQQDLLETLEHPADPRQILWIWDQQGNQGKSWMARYLVAMKEACYMTYGRKADLAYIFCKNPKPIAIFNLSRTTAPTEETENSKKHFLDGIYSLAEDLKDGIMVSTKYDSDTKIFPTPHVVFFANFEPDRSKWSEDRYKVINLNRHDYGYQSD